LNEVSVASQLKKELELYIIGAMSDVGEAVKDEHQDAIERVVYNKYAPRYYKRRMELSGLKDRGNMPITRYGKLGIQMRNITRANPRYGGDGRFMIADSIEYGTGVMAQIGSRPFFAETIRSLKKNGTHLYALKKGLEKQGVKVLSIRKR